MTKGYSCGGREEFPDVFPKELSGLPHSER